MAVVSVTVRATVKDQKLSDFFWSQMCISSISSEIEQNNKYQSIITDSAKPKACQEISKTCYALVYYCT